MRKVSPVEGEGSSISGAESPLLSTAPVADAKYGPGNPHPLSGIRTELVWEGKYDEYGNRRPVDVAGLAMPMQQIETIDEPRSRAEAQGGLFDTSRAHLDDFRNLLVWGDNKLVLASLLREHKGTVDLIYIDPPFDVGADFTMKVPIGDATEEVEKDQSVLEMVAYNDTWGRDTDSYLHMMYERLVLMRDLLSSTGSIFVHCDWHVSALLRAMLDELFGRTNFRNEMVWWYYNKYQGNINRFASNHDTIFWYSKSAEYKFNKQKEKRDKPVQQIKRVWDPDKKALVNDKDPTTGKVLYQESTHRTVDDVWRLSMLQPADKTEFLGYATQKPESLVRRIIEAATDEGDLVADFFCGSGTTGAVAEKLGRRWIMADLGRFSIHTSRKRLIETQRVLYESDKPYRAFNVANLGRYERQWWQRELLSGADEDHRRVVLAFFKADELQHSPSPLLHGRKGGAYCHVDNIDGIFTRDEAGDVASAAADAGAKEVLCLAWEFEMDLRIECNRLETELGISIKLIMIPREIMEKNRKDPPPFLEVATLTAETVFVRSGSSRTVDIALTSFIPSLAEVPTKELEALKERALSSGFDFIDFWAVDFDFQEGQPFHHDWQDYRLRRDRSLKTTSEQRYEYQQPGSYTACVKVVDIFGCDTSISVAIEVD
jgi:adenine-specific DNA-methyltransferase